MKIDLVNAGKRFNREWIFRHVDHQFISGNSYAITGPNGSGKSTFLQVIATSTEISEGSVSYIDSNFTLQANVIYKNISLAAPYLELVEEMTLVEFLSFHNRLKAFINNIDAVEIVKILGLSANQNKQIRYFSSGMKQRVKLSQAIFSDVPVVLLDEPCTNLDAPGIELYKNLIKSYCGDRLVIISSNDVQEYDFCNEVLRLQDMKKFG